VGVDYDGQQRLVNETHYLVTAFDQGHRCLPFRHVHHRFAPVLPEGAKPGWLVAAAPGALVSVVVSVTGRGERRE
jgi:hypothetical protein